MATIAQDNFNRSNRSLDGDTMSDGTSTWALGSNGGLSIVSNQVQTDGASAIEYCDSMANTANVKASADMRRFATKTPAVLARYADPDNFYMSRFLYSGPHCQLYKRVSASWTQLGSNGSDITSWDTVSVKCDGTAISLEINGSTDIGPITDSALATGKAAIMEFVTGAITLDNFLVESLAAAGGVAPQMNSYRRRRVG